VKIAISDLMGAFVSCVTKFSKFIYEIFDQVFIDSEIKIQTFSYSEIFIVSQFVTKLTKSPPKTPAKIVMSILRHHRRKSRNFSLLFLYYAKTSSIKSINLCLQTLQ
jgi:hypothetical protein